MRRVGWLISCGVFLTCLWTHAPAEAAEASASIHVQAQMSSRTSLTVSAQTLHFAVVNASHPATASIDFSAAARTHAGADVVLSIEMPPLSATCAPGCDVTFAGEGDGVLAGNIAASAPAVAARWSGSGQRTGRLVFTLRTQAAGAYTVPVRFVLTAP